MIFNTDNLYPECKEFLMQYLPDSVKCKSKDELLLMLDGFITSTFDEDDEPTDLSRRGEAIYDIIYYCT